MRAPLLAMMMVVCSASCSAEEPGAAPAPDGGPAEAGVADAQAEVASDSGADVPEVADTSKPSTCEEPDPRDPPIACAPSGTAPNCPSTKPAATCPTTSACMAQVAQTGDTLTHRVGRLRLYAPDPLVLLAPLMFDPGADARCVGGDEDFTWLLRTDLAGKTLETGSGPPSADGATFSFFSKTFDAASASALCPGFVGPSAPISLATRKTSITMTGSGFEASLPALDLELDAPKLVLPLREVTVRVPSIGADPSCIGSWSSEYRCEADTLGWTTGGAVVAKISLEEADRIPVKNFGCTSLCAILANDGARVDGKLCKRGADGKIPEWGDACIGGATCGNAVLFSATFGAYGVTIGGS